MLSAMLAIAAARFDRASSMPPAAAQDGAGGVGADAHEDHHCENLDENRRVSKHRSRPADDDRLGQERERSGDRQGQREREPLPWTSSSRNRFAPAAAPTTTGNRSALNRIRELQDDVDQLLSDGPASDGAGHQERADDQRIGRVVQLRRSGLDQGVYAEAGRLAQPLGPEESRTQAKRRKDTMRVDPTRRSRACG